MAMDTGKRYSIHSNSGVHTSRGMVASVYTTACITWYDRVCITCVYTIALKIASQIIG